jgi:hypothetical protein
MCLSKRAHTNFGCRVTPGLPQASRTAFPLTLIWTHDRHKYTSEEQAGLAVETAKGVVGECLYADYHDLGTVDVREVLDEMHAAGSEFCHVAGTWVAFQRV